MQRRLRFTIGSIMIAIAVIAILVAFVMAPRWREPEEIPAVAPVQDLDQRL
jgi:hypothetical protein